MLKNLIIKNYALIQHLEMHPSPALNTITGETGAGKSIMLGAVGLLLGNRADTKALYDKEEKCVVEGIFDLSEYLLQPIFEEEDLDYENNCIIRREISPTGKSRAFINDSPVTLETLKRIGSFLMDVHSQHDTLQLGSNNFQLNVIDAYAGNFTILNNYKATYSNFRKKEKDYNKLVSEAADIKKEADYNDFLLKEFHAAKLVAGEQEVLEEELEMLEHSEEIKTKLNIALEALNKGELAAIGLLHSAGGSLSQISKYSEKYSSLKERLETALIELKDIAEEIEKEEDRVEYDPEKIEFSKNRLSLIYQLQQKHLVKTVEELLSLQKALEDKATRSENLEEQIEQAKLAMETAHHQMMQLAEELGSSRKAVFEKISTELKLLVQNLGMPDASIQIESKEIAPGQSGKDEISFLFSANKGIKPQEIKNVASGGEFSRLMFCVKYILAGKTALPTIVFDEIDAGISGEVALKMVKMMKRMSEKHQVITITHLPQIAAKGDQHYFVFKDNSSTKTISKIKTLSEEERILELAKMIGGDKPSPVAFENAKELLTADF